MPKRLADVVAVRNANHTYLGRLVPLTHAIWLAGIADLSFLPTGWNMDPMPKMDGASLPLRLSRGPSSWQVLVICSI